MGMIFFWVGVIIELVSPYVFINVFNIYCCKYGARSGVEVAHSWS